LGHNLETVQDRR